MRRWVGIVLIAFGASACGLISGGAPTDNDPPPEGQPPTPGDECSDPGETVPAGDGCNTCNCHDGYWQCTLIGCTATPGEGCSQEGDKAPADDHCNTCTCSDGKWICGLTACPPDDGPCEEGSTRPGSDACNTCTCQGGDWLCTENPCEGGSCEGDAIFVEETTTIGAQCDVCQCLQGVWDCWTELCPTRCEDGTVKAAGDGCNTCWCEDGEWLCTEEACTETACPLPDDVEDVSCEGSELIGRAEGTDGCCTLCYFIEGYTYYDSLEACEASKACAPGETKYADDDCNTCTCQWDGTWACTAADCEAVACGGFAGPTCTEDQYCAYQPNELGCGELDGSAYCRPRPTACTEEEDPVCGCDGKTYSNACLANMAGTGLYTDEPCLIPE